LRYVFLKAKEVNSEVLVVDRKLGERDRDPQLQVNVENGQVRSGYVGSIRL